MSTHTDPWGIQLKTGLQVECDPLITSLWAQQTSQFFTLVVVHPSRVYPK